MNSRKNDIIIWKKDLVKDRLAPAIASNIREKINLVPNIRKIEPDLDVSRTLG